MVKLRFITAVLIFSLVPLLAGAMPHDSELKGEREGKINNTLFQEIEENSRDIICIKGERLITNNLRHILRLYARMNLKESETYQCSIFFIRKFSDTEYIQLLERLMRPQASQQLEGIELNFPCLYPEIPVHLLKKNDNIQVVLYPEKLSRTHMQLGGNLFKNTEILPECERER